MNHAWSLICFKHRWQVWKSLEVLVVAVSIWFLFLGWLRAEDNQRFLIVAPDAFHAELQPYVDHKQKQLSTQLLSLESILAESTGYDDPEKLKRYLYREWQREWATYVLLVGDADLFPVRYMVLDRVTKPAFDYAFYPSDLYYADLAKRDGRFEDWNGQRQDFHEGYFGEVRGEANKSDPINYDAIDYLPDVAVGRWPVSNSREVKTIVEKSIRYEENLPKDKKATQPAAALLSIGGWVDSRDVMDGIANKLGASWLVHRLYYSSPDRPSKRTPSEKELLGLLNSGLQLAVHAGHGHDDQWEHCFSLRSLAQVQNRDHLPIVISAGCSTARFATLPPYESYIDALGQSHLGTNQGEVFESPPPPPACYQKGSHNPTGLGEQLLRQGPDGAVAYIGCNTGSQPCGLTLLTGFAQSYTQLDSPRLGDCWNGALRYYHEQQKLDQLKPNNDWYPPSIFFQGMKFMCFGDPTLLMVPN